MFVSLFFIVPVVFLILAIALPFCIIEKIPNWLTVNIGSLSTDDVRKLDCNNRLYLRRKIAFYLFLSVAVTLLISLAFILFGNADNALIVILCETVNLIVALSISLQILKIAKELKVRISKSNNN